ncbi:MAG: N-acetylmuramoyl-L-alanine amidase [Candidatus Liptonbacteria bacterium]|nr:N-acetylmuramoyl-L-alanine amidase [Candidatus Liptonbacteria bacterium]
MKFLALFLFASLSFVFFNFIDQAPVLTSIYNITNFKNFFAGIFFVASTSEKYLKAKYAEAENGGEPIKILVVPGHDGVSVGAQFKNVKETDLTAELGEYLAEFFGGNKKFEIILSRDKDGYSSEFSSYFEKERSSIESFMKTYRLYMKTAIDSGLVNNNQIVSHNEALPNGAIKLYGINKWANENNVDIVIHIHFNDHPGHPVNQPGKYSGFAIYVPEKQYSNSEASMAIARKIFDWLNAYGAPSDMPLESSGIVEEQELIAVGSNNALNPAGMLIEYDYIYEPQFLYPETRQATLKELAFQTYSGIKDFFENNSTDAAKFSETTLLPHQWKSDMEEGLVGNMDVFSLQASLASEGIYPPPGFTKNNCPITGSFKKCTVAAVKELQKKYGIEPTGYVGEKTRKILNEMYISQHSTVEVY